MGKEQQEDEKKNKIRRKRREEVQKMKEITEEYAGAVAFVLTGGLILRVFGEVLRMVSL